jgi:ABC-type lipoprotein release transport system permease subunit
MLIYLLAEGRHRTSRALGSLAGVALGVALFVSIVSAADSFLEAARRPLADVGADIVVSRADGGASPEEQTTRGVRQPFGLTLVTSEEVDQLRRMPGVNEASGGILLWDFSANSYQTLLGVDLGAEDLEAADSQTGGSSAPVGPANLAGSIVAGRFFTHDERDVVVVDRHFAAFFALKPGAAVKIGEHSFEVIGIVDAAGAQSGGADFYLPIFDARALAGLADDQFNQVYVRVDEATRVDAVIADAEAELGEISATTEQSIVSVMGGITQISGRFAMVAAVVALAGGLILTSVTLRSGINLRVREVGVMRATGWQARDVVRLFTVEGVALSMLGGTLGIFLGWLAIVAIAQVPVQIPSARGSVPNLGGEVSADTYTIAAHLSWGTALAAVAASLLVAGLASAVSARRVARLKPAETLRS